MSIGDHIDSQALDRLVRIERRVTTRDALGGETVTYTLRAEVHAAVIHTRGREAFLNQQTTPAADAEVRIRWRTDVDLSDRIVHDGQAYDIQYLAEMGRRRRLRILVKLPGDAPT